MNASNSSRLARLESQLRDFLDATLHGVPDETILEPPVTGKWSALENLAHLARYHEMFMERIERIRKEDCPALTRYSAENDPGWLEWATLPVNEVLAGLRDLRAQMLELVEKLSEAELSRTAVHSRFGEMTLIEWLEFFLLHEAHHLLAVMQRARE